MKRFLWMAFVTCFLMSVPVYGMQFKIANLSPEGSIWMQKIQAGADEIQRKTSNRVRFKFFSGGIMVSIPSTWELSFWRICRSAI